MNILLKSQNHKIVALRLLVLVFLLLFYATFFCVTNITPSFGKKSSEGGKLAGIELIQLLEIFLSPKRKKIRPLFSQNHIFHDQKLFLQKNILVVKNRVLGKKLSPFWVFFFCFGDKKNFLFFSKKSCKKFQNFLAVNPLKTF